MQITPEQVATPIHKAIVVGAGIAGLCAAHQLLECGIAVTVIDSADQPGGNCRYASPDTYVADAGDEIPNASLSDAVRWRTTESAILTEDLISTNTTRSPMITNFLRYFGLDITDASQLHAHHLLKIRNMPPTALSGPYMVRTLCSAVQTRKGFSLRLKCTMTGFLMTDLHVVGVECEANNGTERLYGPVVFATRGFGCDRDLVAQYCPAFTDLPTSNILGPLRHTPLITIGAKMVEMNKVQLYPIGYHDQLFPKSWQKSLIPETLLQDGALLLHGGTTIINGLGTRAEIAKDIMSHPKSLKNRAI
ncbi:flavocytochrome c [Stemphylium lycopersici]|nr:flavocytochrome c [Stemphylium lycopersici]